jgi:hypothetical protein
VGVDVRVAPAPGPGHGTAQHLPQMERPTAARPASNCGPCCCMRPTRGRHGAVAVQ